MRQHFEVLGTGHYLPACEVTAEETDRRLGKPNGWTAQHAGVRTRYECRSPETLVTMAREAIARALDDASLDWSQVDSLVDASACRQQPIPCNAALIQAEIGSEAYGVPCFDVQSTCLGFLVALNLVNGLFAAGGCQHVVVVCSEACLAGANWDEPESAALLGDGAAAAVLGRREPQGELIFAHETFSEHVETCYVRGGGHRLPPHEYEQERDSDYRFHMDGPTLFRIARRRLPPLAERTIEAAEVERSSLHVIPHQASPRAVERVRRLLRISPAQYHDQVSELGNMASASIPMVLDRTRRSGRLGKGDSVMLLGTSAGYSQAAMILQL